MNLLESLAGGLRGAAGVLSPDIQQRTMAEDQQNNAMRQQQKMQMAQHIQKQVESGAMAPEAGVAALVQLGAPQEVAKQMVGGPGMAAQTQAVALERAKRQEAATTRIMSDPGIQEALQSGDARKIQKVMGVFIANQLPIPAHLKDIMESTRLEQIGAGGARDPRSGEIFAPVARPTTEGAQRTVQKGDQRVTERFTNGKWEEVGSGPMFARQVAPIVNIGGSGGGSGGGRPLTDIAKLNEDLKAGRITQEQFDADMSKRGIGVNLMGGRESVFLNRVLTASNQVNKDLQNIVLQPLSASRGIFGGRSQGKSLFEAAKETLATSMTTQEVQSYNVLATGIQRNLAAIESAGLAPPNSLMHMMDAVVFKEGDTNFTKLQKLAQTRQVVEAGLETILSNPRMAPEQKQHAQQLLDDVRKAVPFSGRDVIKLGTLQQTDPKATLKSVMESEKRAGGRAPQAALDYLRANPGTKDAFKAKYGYLPEGM